MRRYLVYLFLGAALIAFGCSEERVSAPPTTQDDFGASSLAEATAWALVQQAGWPVEVSENEFSSEAVAQSQGNIPLFKYERTVISGDVVHYSVIVRTGNGRYDRIGLHRVVRETQPYVPIRTDKALFMLHGDLKRFETMFIPGQFSPTLPNDFGIAVYLAQNDVDVWGIDQGWNLVPAEETDFSFFADWGVQKEVDHLDTGLKIARLSRQVTGNGRDKMLLLGYSSGAITGYALLNQEAQTPPARRQVKGFIAADAGVRSDDPDWLALWPELLSGYESIYNAGQYQDPLIFRDVAFLARWYADDPSPYIPEFTNLQTALYFGGGLIFSTTTVTTYAHYHAPILDQSGLPEGFQFITVEQWLDFLDNSAAYEPMLFEVEYARVFAGLASPYVTHLSDITVPVFDLGAAGGAAPYTTATLSYLGSTDITQLYVSTGGELAEEYGHIDIFTANNAPGLVWVPVLEWIQDHSE